MDQAELDRRFKYHSPSEFTQEVHEFVRNHYIEFAEVLAESLPESREKALAFTALEESHFWAHAAIAREAK